MKGREGECEELVTFAQDKKVEELPGLLSGCCSRRQGWTSCVLRCYENPVET